MSMSSAGPPPSSSSASSEDGEERGPKMVENPSTHPNVPPPPPPGNVSVPMHRFSENVQGVGSPRSRDWGRQVIVRRGQLWSTPASVVGTAQGRPERPRKPSPSADVGELRQVKVMGVGPTFAQSKGLISPRNSTGLADHETSALFREVSHLRSIVEAAKDHIHLELCPTYRVHNKDAALVEVVIAAVTERRAARTREHTLEEALRAREDQLRAVKETVHSVRRQLQNEVRERAKVNSKLAGLQSKLQRVENEDSLFSRALESEAAILEVRNKYVDLEKELRICEFERDDARKERDDAKKERDIARRERDDSRQKVTELEHLLRQVEHRNQVLEQSQLEAKSISDSFEQALAEQRTKHTEQIRLVRESVTTEMHDALKSLAKQAEEAERAHEQVVEALKAQIQTDMENAQWSERAQGALRAQHVVEMEALERELESEREGRRAERENFRERKASLDFEKEELREKYNDAEQRLITMRYRIADLTNRTDDLQRRVQQYDQEHHSRFYRRASPPQPSPHPAKLLHPSDEVDDYLSLPSSSRSHSLPRQRPPPPIGAGPLPKKSKPQTKSRSSSVPHSRPLTPEALHAVGKLLRASQGSYATSQRTRAAVEAAFAPPQKISPTIRHRPRKHIWNPPPGSLS